jgi:uncharacterized membrane protein YfcA
MPETAALLQMLALLLGVGAFAGLIAGLLGVGGGIVLVPAFFYALGHLGYAGGQLMQVCVATSLATIVFTSVRSVQAHHAKGAVDVAMLRSFAPMVVFGALIGTLIATQVSSLALQGVFGVLAGLAGLYMAFGRANWRLGEQLPPQPLRGVIAGALGLGSAMMGIGGGTFGVPLMTLYGYPIHRAVGTASGLGVIIALPAMLGFLALPVADAPPFSIGAVNLPAFAAVILTTYITTPWGAALAHRMDPAPLKRAFSAFLVLVAFNMLRKALGL